MGGTKLCLLLLVGTYAVAREYWDAFFKKSIDLEEEM